MSRGKVHWTGSGRNHPGNVAWPLLPQRLRGAIIVGGKVVDGRPRPYSFEAARRRAEAVVAGVFALSHTFKSKGVRR